MPDLATIGSRLPFMWLQPRGPALTTNLTKVLFFEKNARKTQNKARRDRLLRAARRYLLAAAKDLEPLPRVHRVLSAARHINQWLGSAFRPGLPPRLSPILAGALCWLNGRQISSTHQTYPAPAFSWADTATKRAARR